ncbi:hypothetical protein vBBcePLY3_00026 [Bacillus phage vB_BceP_LY3]|uniref:Uncharacterized protein n=1 Tax=Bacillus phage vB_BceP_LY3 TaxID=2950458 RepID=A0AAE9LV80_9CAUD|nr:hypothetical protein vBBcePLY3_00026 [Bacillus phage vB_BceP_LY3]
MKTYEETYGYKLILGEKVKTHTEFWFYDDFYEVGKEFVVTEEMVLHGFEKFVSII